eukprot:15477596-Alexandrium_andersonii.AAC.1
MHLKVSDTRYPPRIAHRPLPRGHELCVHALAEGAPQAAVAAAKADHDQLLNRHNHLWQGL